jgi:hypothetical protein
MNAKDYNYFLEIFGFLAVITTVNLIWARDNMGFVGVSPHPYWIVIIAVTLKYELRQAMDAVIVSSLMYFLMTILFHGVQPSQFLEFQFFKPIILFIVLGVFGGQVRTGQNQKLRALQEEKEKLEKKYANLRKQTDELAKIKDELSQRIVGQSSTVSTVYELAKQMNILDIDSLIPSGLDFIVQIVGAQKCSFYQLEDAELKLVEKVGWTTDDERKYQNNSHDELVRQALENQRVVALTEAFEQQLEDAPEKVEANVVMSAPIFVGAVKKPYGVVNIESIPFLKFNPDSIKLFSLISDWISHTLTLAFEIEGFGKLADKSEEFEQYIKENFRGVFDFGKSLSEMREGASASMP